ncbi:MAG: hypothetical protein K0Q60_4872, partial [Microvirga sp.]|nr:hypothetical protein [Microvirga sp.]
MWAAKVNGGMSDVQTTLKVAAMGDLHV